MEALGAFGLACNVMQTINFGLETTSVCRSFYRGQAPAADIGHYRDRLEGAAKGLQASLSSPTGSLEKEERRLNDVATELVNIAHMLGDELKKCNKNTCSSMIKSFSKAIKYQTRKHKIDELETAVKRWQSVMETELLLWLKKKTTILFNESHQNFQKLDQKVFQFMQQLHVGNTRLEQLVEKSSGNIKEVIIQEAEKSRLQQTMNMHDMQVTIVRESERMRDHVDQNIDKERLARQSQSCLKSLEYQEMGARATASAINNSYEDSFQWIFSDTLRENNEDPPSKWSNFSEWLRSDGTIYWITGKPGAGKSSLIRFITCDRRCKKDLGVWRSEAELFSAYIWKAGSPLQRSQRGLFATLLLDLLTAHNEVITNLDASFAGKTTIMHWTTRELFKTLTMALQVVQKPICIFIDGLDEIESGEDDGAHGLLSRLMHLASLPNIKLCLGSREEIVFHVRLKTYPRLRLQDLTYNDMQAYVEDALATTLSNTTEDDLLHISLAILDKAQGVFLWARLVTTSIRNGLIGFEGPDELLKRVDLLPSELQDLYKEMWGRLSEIDQALYLSDASLCFNLVCHSSTSRSNPTMSVFQLLICLRPKLRENLLSGGIELTEEYLAKETKIFRRQLSVRCAGLLETRTAEDADFADYLRNGRDGVQFIHRSARDFLVDTVEGDAILQFERRSILQLSCLQLTSSIATSLFLLSSNKQWGRYHEWYGLVSRPIQFSLPSLCDLAPALRVPALEFIASAFARKSCRCDNPQEALETAIYVNSVEVLRNFLNAFSEHETNEAQLWRSRLLRMIVHDPRLYDYTEHRTLLLWLLQEGADPNRFPSISEQLNGENDRLMQTAFVSLLDKIQSSSNSRPDHEKSLFVQLIFDFLDRGADIETRFLMPIYDGSYYSYHPKFCFGSGISLTKYLSLMGLHPSRMENNRAEFKGLSSADWPGSSFILAEFSVLDLFDLQQQEIRNWIQKDAVDSENKKKIMQLLQARNRKLPQPRFLISKTRQKDGQGESRIYRFNFDDDEAVFDPQDLEPSVWNIAHKLKHHLLLISEDDFVSEIVRLGFFPPEAMDMIDVFPEGMPFVRHAEDFSCFGVDWAYKPEYNQFAAAVKEVLNNEKETTEKALADWNITIDPNQSFSPRLSEKYLNEVEREREWGERPWKAKPEIMKRWEDEHPEFKGLQFHRPRELWGTKTEIHVEENEKVDESTASAANTV